jgi:histidinol-phosphate/aromatic aminotransferase/cobyric acid decarboxylase-like protein
MSGSISPDVSALDFGAQGGDPSRGVDIDLSTCVNRYGPAPAAIAALRAIEPADIVLHPYEAAPQIIDLYRGATGVPDGAMIAGRGATEFIWAMGRELDHASVQVPMPAYTDYLKVFPGRGFSPAGEQIPSLDQIDEALNAAGVVIICGVAPCRHARSRRKEVSAIDSGSSGGQPCRSRCAG